MTAASPIVSYENKGRTGDGTVGDTLGNSIKLFLMARKYMEDIGRDMGHEERREAERLVRYALAPESGTYKTERRVDYVLAHQLYTKCQLWRLSELHGLAFDRVYDCNERYRREKLREGQRLARGLRRVLREFRDQALADAREAEKQARALRKALKVR
jgi:hypothetical protein